MVSEGIQQKKSRPDDCWRKSRLAARLLIRKYSAAGLRPREQALARRLRNDPEVSNRLIQQALYYLGIGSRKAAFDKQFLDSQIKANRA